ncbi:hypothetical protein G0R83_004974 [Salmonella enterica]|uniref:Uncharacterized protein n=1 Tax=Salmonella enterica TaxID=28901 RepID=A0A749KY04_SALER|nr:hypothetical protein [Salmonella enterica]EEI4534989.1 hypothetical protein [Salmonella enterica]EJP3911746.1 hypothetical protein [Salmonella enterica]HAF5756235.1 hypothetical protein [Salmonella enterica]
MIAELSAAISALKETAQLVKVFSNAKTEAEVRSAVDALNAKLISAQCECMSLIELARSYQEETVALKAKIAEFENFQAQTEGYILNQLESGAFVYSKEEAVNGCAVTMHLCPKCFGQKVVSVLQPFPVSKDALFHKSRCLHCENLFLMNKNPDYMPPPSIEELSRKLNGNL